MVGKGDEFAVVGGAGGLGDEAEDSGGTHPVVAFVQHQPFRLIHCIQGVFVGHKSSAYMGRQRISELRAPQSRGVPLWIFILNLVGGFSPLAFYAQVNYEIGIGNNHGRPSRFAWVICSSVI